MNAPLRRVAVACMVLFGLLMVNATYLQGLRAEELQNRQGNVRVLYKEYATKRGPIVVGGTRVAYSTATNDELKYLRVYRHGRLYAHATGYYSLFGASAIEQEKDDVLAGTDERFFVQRLVNMATGERRRGGVVELTIDPAAQRAAYSALAGQPGAAVALDPETGDILAMVSTPSYDPNELASHESEKVRRAYERLESAESQPLLNRAISRTYPPGSTFKVVTAAAALSTERYQPSSVIPAPTVLDLPLTTATLRNYAGESCAGGGTLTIRDALRISCNTAFANLGMQLGGQKLRQQARAFGFGHSFEVPMESAESVFPQGLNAPQTAFSAIGQYDVRATPLQMAMVAAAVANDGVVMRPHRVAEVKGPDLSTIDEVRPQEYGRAVSPEVARQLTQMMTLVVEEGTGTSAQIPGVAVAGKTGTAEHGQGNPAHAWFISFAPAQNPQVAVAVVVPNAGTTGSQAAAPVAEDIMRAVLGQ